MNIGLFFTFDYSLKSWSESGTLQKELKIFQKLNNEYNVKFTLFTYGDEADISIASNFKNFEVVPIYKEIKYFKSKILRILYSLLIPFKLKSKVKDLDIIQQHQIFGIWVTLILKFLSKKPLYIRTGYDAYEFSIKESKSHLIQYFYKFLTYLGLKFSNFYSVASFSDFNFIKFNFKHINQNLVIRPNWVEDISINTKKLRNKILTVGRLENQKNFQLLINEFQNTSHELEIDIVGSGKLKKELEILSRKKNVKVNFLGIINNEELMKLYSKYYFYISTSLYEGNPKSILEALSNGCIVFASNIPNHAEIIQDKKNGYLFDLEKPELLKIFKEVSNLNNLDLLSYQVKKQILRTNNINKIAFDYWEDYQKVLNLLR